MLLLGSFAFFRLILDTFGLVGAESGKKEKWSFTLQYILRPKKKKLKHYSIYFFFSGLDFTSFLSWKLVAAVERATKVGK